VNKMKLPDCRLATNVTLYDREPLQLPAVLPDGATHFVTFYVDDKFFRGWAWANASTDWLVWSGTMTAPIVTAFDYLTDGKLDARPTTDDPNPASTMAQFLPRPVHRPTNWPDDTDPTDCYATEAEAEAAARAMYPVVQFRAEPLE